MVHAASEMDVNTISYSYSSRDTIAILKMSFNDQRKLFDNYCKQQFGEDGAPSTKMITREKGQEIAQMLRSDPAAEQYGPKF